MAISVLVVSATLALVLAKGRSVSTRGLLGRGRLEGVLPYADNYEYELEAYVCREFASLPSPPGGLDFWTAVI